jgi:hypothetical protein
MQSDAAEVLAWRRRLVALGMTQPFKQAHREIYVLTDAERAARLYSNRFAAHIIEQHKFRAVRSRPRVRLLFEGDMTLSLILSKAFMLADDDNIKDKSIRSQIAAAGDGIPLR